MTDLIMQLAGVLQRDVDSLKSVSMNVANANTPGYRETRAFNVYSPAPGTHQVAQGLDTISTQVAISTQGGTLQVSGRPTDLAVDGDGWFALSSAQGVVLTRDGRFHVNDAGVLVSASNLQVLGRDGPLQVDGGVMKVDEAGTVSVDGQPVGQLSIVRVADSRSLRTEGVGLYSSDQPLQPASTYKVRQSMQERSNVALGNDMVKMMEVTRHVESVQRALSAYDGLLDKGINQLGKD